MLSRYCTANPMHDAVRTTTTTGTLVKPISLSTYHHAHVCVEFEFGAKNELYFEVDIVDVGCWMSLSINIRIQVPGRMEKARVGDL